MPTKVSKEPRQKGTSSTRKRASKTDPLIGTWFNGDEIASHVVFEISHADDTYAVNVRDAEDGEKADVFETNWDGRILSFAAHWKSSGRFVRYRLQLLSANRVDVTYTYTESQMYHRKS